MITNKKVNILQTHGLGDVLMVIPLIITLTRNNNKVLLSLRNQQAYRALLFLNKKLDLNISIALVPKVKTPLILIRYIFLVVTSRFDYTLACYSVNHLQSRILNCLSIFPRLRYLPFNTKVDDINKNIISHKVQYNESLAYSFYNESFVLTSKNQYSSLLNNTDDRLIFKSNAYEDNKIFIISPGSGILEKHKRWPIRNYALISNYIVENIENSVVLVVGSPSDVYLEKYFNFNQVSIINLIGKCDFPELFDLYRRSFLVLTHCSGSAHIAALAGSYIYFLSGPTSFELTGPYSERVKVFKSGAPCSPCYSKKNLTGCEYDGCRTQMELISVETIVSNLKNYTNFF